MELSQKLFFAFIKCTFLIFLFISLNISALLAQNKFINQRDSHHEQIDDEYMPLLNPKKSPAYKSRSSLFFTAQVNVDEDGNNILGDAANEPSIAVDPSNPDNIIIGWRQFDNVSSNFRQAGVAYTNDGGETWVFDGVIEPGVFRSDPVLGVNNEGVFYYNSLTTDNFDYWCNVYRSYNSGWQWDQGVFAQGGDKQWMVVDKTESVGNGNIYSNWTSFYSYCYPNYFTRSTDDGDNYENCVDIPGNPYWGTLNTGPDGELYVAGTNGNGGIVVSRSDNAKDGGFIMWDMLNTDVDLDGSVYSQAAVNPAGLVGQVWFDVDRSEGSGRANVYVCASVYRDLFNDPADVMFTRSTDGGVSWDEPWRINTDEGFDNYSWFGTMSVAPNGRIDVVWLDTRDAVSYPYLSALYYSYSIDNGVSWSDNEKLSELFNPNEGYPNQDKMGDYFDMVSDNDGAHLAWANTLNGEQDVYYGHITPWYVGIEENITSKDDFHLINYPNPFKEETTIRYELEKTEKVNISIFDTYGKLIFVLKDEIQNSGLHNIVFNAKELNPGIYYCRINAGGKRDYQKIIKTASRVK
ncbi:MAG: hypothetical protein C0598_05075 [Marinilabiliales bacterium]|nr:MAG: hypothetical protein C0598_05075 [Marinilabiliales bacterium]